MPVLPDDALIMCLDDLPSSSGPAEGEDKKNQAAAAAEPQPAGAESADLTSKNAALEAQLEALTKQFASYRLAVEQTLDKRWHAEDDDSSSTSSAASPPQKQKEDSSKYYWESYANHGNMFSLVRRPLPRNWLCKTLTFGAKYRHSRDDAEGHSANGCIP